MNRDYDQTAPSNVGNDVIAEFMRLYRTQRRRCDEETGALRAIVKRAKSEGINVEVLLLVERMRKLDQAEVVLKVRDQIRYMDVARIPVSSDDLFGGWQPGVTEKTRHADDIFSAQDAGYTAGKAGADTADCPYDPGTELHAAWLDWWDKGQEVIARQMEPDGEAANATRSRPRRAANPLPLPEPAAETSTRTRKQAATKKQSGRKNGSGRPPKGGRRLRAGAEQAAG